MIEWMKKLLESNRETSDIFPKQVYEELKDLEYLPFVKKSKFTEHTLDEFDEKDLSKSKLAKSKIIEGNVKLEKITSVFEGLVHIFKKENIVEDFEKYVDIRKDSIHGLLNANPGDGKGNKFLTSLVRERETKFVLNFFLD